MDGDGREVGRGGLRSEEERVQGVAGVELREERHARGLEGAVQGREGTLLCAPSRPVPVGEGIGPEGRGRLS